MRAAALVAGVVLSVSVGPAAAADVEITSGPVGTIQQDTATFTFTPEQAECSVDAAAFAPCTSPFTISGLSNSLHTLAVRAGADSAPVTASWSVLVPKVLPILIPARVVGIAVDREPHEAMITWRPVYGATAYQVTIGSTTKTVHRPRLAHLKTGKKYRVTIVATNRYGSSPMAPFTVMKYHKH